MSDETIGFYSYGDAGDAESSDADRFSNFIVYPYGIGPQWDGVGCYLVLPNPTCGLTIEEIARKDVPEGQPFLILTYNDFPWTDGFKLLPGTAPSWRVDFSNPDGIGERVDG